MTPEVLAQKRDALRKILPHFEIRIVHNNKCELSWRDPSNKPRMIFLPMGNLDNMLDFLIVVGRAGAEAALNEKGTEGKQLIWMFQHLNLTLNDINQFLGQRGNKRYSFKLRMVRERLEHVKLSLLTWRETGHPPDEVVPDGTQ